MNLLDKALELAHAGLFVFPCAPGEKTPLPGSRGCTEASKDPEQIRRWWTGDPTRNIGIACGPSGIFVVDCDLKDDINGLDQFTSLWVEENGDLPDFNQLDYTDTPSGGRHIFFRGSGRNSAKRLCPGVDTRGAGGYVLAPGSVVNGKAYTGNWKNIKQGKVHFPALPEFISRRCTAAVEREEGRREEKATADALDDVQRAVTWLEAREPAIQGHGGDNWTFATIAWLRDLNISKDMAHSLALAFWNDRCIPAWSADELRTKVDNVYAYAANEAGSKAPSEEWKALLFSLGDKAKEDKEAAKNRWYSSQRFGDMIQNEPEPEWLVPGLIEPRSLMQTYGPYGSGKTFAMLWQGLAFALGREWFGHQPAKPLKVLYCIGEGAFSIYQRIKAWCDKNGVAIPDNFVVQPRIPLFDGGEDWAAFREYVSERGFQLAYFDTQQYATLGFEENSASEMARFVKRCLDDLTCAVHLIHHTGKDQNKGARGSVVIPASASLVMKLTPAGDGSVLIGMEKLKSGETWKHKKGMLLRPFNDQLVAEETVATEQNEAKAGKILAAVAEAGERSTRQKRVDQVVEFLEAHRGHPYTVEQLKPQLLSWLLGLAPGGDFSWVPQEFKKGWNKGPFGQLLDAMGVLHDPGHGSDKVLRAPEE